MAYSGKVRKGLRKWYLRKPYKVRSKESQAEKSIKAKFLTW
jgi:hypothetical protein